jgi:hypothetical protein
MVASGGPPYVQDETRHAALWCLPRVTADDIRRRYSPPLRSGTAGREQFADRHKTVARLPTVADVASERSSRHRKAIGPLIHCIAAF